LGRRDHQVKIRGFRIETGEIENQLLTHPEITGAVVIPGETPEGKREEYLCAYMVTQREFEVSELRRFLSHTLPNHMIPSYFISIDQIPLTPTGKVDRKVLLKNGSTLGTGIEYVEPGNELEKMIAQAWKDVLKKDKVGIHDNFFDIGGDSLKAIRLNSRLNELLNKKLSIVVLFEHVTIHSFIRYLNHEETRPGISRQRIDRSEVIDKVMKTRADRKMKRRWGNVNA
jgi:aryl carrier-like protein